MGSSLERAAGALISLASGEMALGATIDSSCLLVALGSSGERPARAYAIAALSGGGGAYIAAHVDQLHLQTTPFTEPALLTPTATMLGDQDADLQAGDLACDLYGRRFLAARRTIHDPDLVFTPLQKPFFPRAVQSIGAHFVFPHWRLACGRDLFSGGRENGDIDFAWLHVARRAACPFGLRP